MQARITFQILLPPVMTQIPNEHFTDGDLHFTDSEWELDSESSDDHTSIDMLEDYNLDADEDYVPDPPLSDDGSWFLYPLHST